MAKIKRNIIRIDEDKCNGCGLCIPACPEGALQIIDGKARLVKETFCDGLGACLGDCPENALHIVERDVEYYDAGGVVSHIKRNSPDQLGNHYKHIDKHKDEINRITEDTKTIAPPACPGSKMMQWITGEEPPVTSTKNIQLSQLRQWPVQLHLLPPNAPYFKDANLMIIADCVAFAYGNFQEDFVKDKAIAIGCPKLDDVNAYLDKIARIIAEGKPRSVTVVYMEVPCCMGMVKITEQALASSGRDIPMESVLISIKGDIIQKRTVRNAAS